MTRNRVISRHLTSTGVVVWSRDEHGRLHMEVFPLPGGERPLAAGGRGRSGPR